MRTSKVCEALLLSFFDRALLIYHRIELDEGIGIWPVSEFHIRSTFLIHEGLATLLNEVDSRLTLLGTLDLLQDSCTETLSNY
jgi:hypothetical protein